MSKEKEATIERMANKIMNIPSVEVRAQTFTIMAIYASARAEGYECGKAAGIEEERHRWEQKLAATI